MKKSSTMISRKRTANNPEPYSPLEEGPSALLKFLSLNVLEDDSSKATHRCSNYRSPTIETLTQETRPNLPSMGLKNPSMETKDDMLHSDPLNSSSPSFMYPNSEPGLQEFCTTLGEGCLLSPTNDAFFIVSSPDLNVHHEHNPMWTVDKDPPQQKFPPGAGTCPNFLKRKVKRKLFPGSVSQVLEDVNKLLDLSVTETEGLPGSTRYQLTGRMEGECLALPLASHFSSPELMDWKSEPQETHNKESDAQCRFLRCLNQLQALITRAQRNKRRLELLLANHVVEHCGQQIGGCVKDQIKNRKAHINPQFNVPDCNHFALDKSKLGVIEDNGQEKQVKPVVQGFSKGMTEMINSERDLNYIAESGSTEAEETPQKKQVKPVVQEFSKGMTEMINSERDLHFGTESSSTEAEETPQKKQVKPVVQGFSKEMTKIIIFEQDLDSDATESKTYEESEGNHQMEQVQPVVLGFSKQMTKMINSERDFNYVTESSSPEAEETPQKKQVKPVVQGMTEMINSEQELNIVTKSSSTEEEETCQKKQVKPVVQGLSKGMTKRMISEQDADSDAAESNHYEESEENHQMEQIKPLVQEFAKGMAKIINSVQWDLDSDATESSSNEESEDNSKKSYKSNAEWDWLLARAQIASRCTWLQDQISNLEFKIQQVTHLHGQIRQTKAMLVFEELPSVKLTKPTLDSNPSTSKDLEMSPSSPTLLLRNIEKQSAQLTNMVSSLMPASTFSPDCKFSLENKSFKTENEAPGSPSRLDKARRRSHRQIKGKRASSKAFSSSGSSCARSRPLKLCSKRNLYELDSCGTALYSHDGRYDESLETSNLHWTSYGKPLPPLLVKGNVSAIDSHFHPVLSFASDVPLHLYLNGLLKSNSSLKGDAMDSTRYSQEEDFGAVTIDYFNNEKENIGADMPSQTFSSQLEDLSDEAFSCRHEKYEQKEKARRSCLQHHKWSKKSRSSAIKLLSSTYPPYQPHLDRIRESSHDIAQRRRWRSESSYDIDNIVIPMNLVAPIRLEKLQYKEIQTPSWKEVVYEPLEGDLDGELEDLSDEAFSCRHKKYEQKEKARRLFWQHHKWTKKSR